MKAIKKILRIVLLSPFIVVAICVDLIKLPIVVCIVMPLTFLLALKDLVDGEEFWFEDWKEFNYSFATFGCAIIKEDF